MAVPSGIPHLVHLVDHLDIYRLPDRPEARILVLHGEHVTRSMSAGSSEIAFVAESHTYYALANEIRRILDDEAHAPLQSPREAHSPAIPRLREVRILRARFADLSLHLREDCLVLRADNSVYVFEAGNYPFETDGQNLEGFAALLLQLADR